MERQSLHLSGSVVVTRRGQITPPRVWFPLPSERLRRSSHFYIEMADRSAVFAFDRTTIGPIYDHFSIPKQQLIREARRRAGIFPGYRLPVHTLPAEWYFESTTGIDPKYVLTILYAHICLHMQVGIPSSLQFGEFSNALDALETGRGTSAQIATLLTAVLRANGISAKVIGNPDFFGPNRSYWWVQAYPGGEIVVLDTRISPVLLRQFRKQHLAPMQVATALMELLYEDHLLVGPLSNSRYLERAKEAFPASEAEIE